MTEYVNRSSGIEYWHTSDEAVQAYTYVPADADMPPLYSQELIADPLVRVKLFTPDGDWVWYLTEWDGTAMAFGLCCGFVAELGYVDLDEVSEVRGAFGLPIERDIHWQPTLLSVVKQRELGRGR